MLHTGKWWLGALVRYWDQLDQGEIIFDGSNWFLVDWIASDTVQLTQL